MGGKPAAFDHVADLALLFACDFDYLVSHQHAIEIITVPLLVHPCHVFEWAGQCFCRRSLPACAQRGGRVVSDARYRFSRSRLTVRAGSSSNMPIETR